MTNLLSPGIETKEINLYSAIGSAATGRGAMVGKFEWGPSYQLTIMTSESDVVDFFGRSNDYTAASFMSATNFLKQANDLRLVRICNADIAKNASAVYSAVDFVLGSEGTATYVVGDELDISLTSDGTGIAEKGIVKAHNGSQITSLWIPSSELVSLVDSDAPTFNLTLSSGSKSQFTATCSFIGDSGLYFPNRDLAYNSMMASAPTTEPTFADYCDKFQFHRISAQYVGNYGDNIAVDIINKTDFDASKNDRDLTNPNRGDVNLTVYPDGGTRSINPSSYFSFGPETSNQYAIIVRVGGEVVETHIVSTSKTDKDINGQTIYIDEYFENGGSRFVYAVSDGWLTESNSYNFGGGIDVDANTSDWMFALDLLSDPELLEVNLIIAGNAAAEPIDIASNVQKYAINSVGEVRKDCVIFCSPPAALLINKTAAEAVDGIVSWRTGKNSDGSDAEFNLNVNSTYAVIDGNYKYQYDKYSDRNRWVPLAADIAGLCANTDRVAQPWESPAGFNRGQISGINRLAVDLRRAHRDSLYDIGINSVVGFSGQGYILFGDKTATQQNSAFDRINVRRLFNLLKKAISDSAKYKLFELNNTFTRRNFKSEVDAYLTNIQDLGGIYDFVVVCDETNNGGTVVDRNEFVASIYIKPARSINFITLNFVATATDADFSELV